MKDEVDGPAVRKKRRQALGLSKPPKTPLVSKVVPDIWSAEEEEIEKRDPEKDLNLFRQACGNIRRLMKEIVELKAAKNPSLSEISERRIQATLLFITLKKLNRLEKLRNRKARDSTNEAKQKVDTHHLQLQNLLYESTHLSKEVNKCMEFKSKDEEIQLVSVEEFYKEAPALISRPETTKNDIHEQKLAQLDWELEQRKRLAAQCKKSEASKDLILQDIKKKKEYLETLAPCLTEILQATIPVQELLGLRQEVKRVQNKNAHFLPTPLFILYVQANAYVEAWDKRIFVAVQGDVDEAKALKDSAEERDEDSGDSDQEESQREKGFRRNTTDKLTEMRKKILKKHPLEVVVTIITKGKEKLKLIFSYIAYLHIVTVTPSLELSNDLPTPSRNVLAPSVLLNCLFENDFGNDTPNQANHYQLKRLGMDEFKSYLPELGYPYAWAQRLAGMNFVQEESIEDATGHTTLTPSSKVSSSHLEQIIRAVRNRLSNRLELQKQLHDLEQGTVGVRGEAMGLFPTKISTRLTSFSSIPWEDYEMIPQTKVMINKGLVSSSSFTFKATMERGSAKLIALIAISPHYPEEPPVFVLKLEWKEAKNSLEDSALWDIEKEVNVYWEELISSMPQFLLLTNQIMRLLMCFDVYLETEANIETVEGPQEFAKEKVFFQQCRGRSRSKPYKYIPKLGLFVHR